MPYETASAARRPRASATILLLALVVFAFAVPAHAEEPWSVPSNVYTEFAGGMEWVNLPEVTAYFSPVLGADFSSTDDEFLRWTAEGVIGYADPDGLSLPDPFGQNARIELRIRYSEGDSDRDDNTLNAVGIVTPDALNAFASTPGTALSNTSLQTWDADIAYQTDVALTDHLIFTPLVGLTYTRLDLANDFKVPSVVLGRIEMNDEVTAHYYGVALGAAFSLRPATWIQFDLGLRGDLLGATANLDVEYDAGPAVNRTESDNDTNFAPRGSATAGVQLNFGNISLGVEGHARYTGYLPIADHPLAGLATGQRPSNIDGDDLWAVGAMGRFTIWWP